ncbi:alkaline phosphatase family protein [Micromonospora sp. NPDC047134]|uniref:alkaline phosphatase family protein n=1 Tax=Micromonospora sp. NPDC047134 TaxID=3154340 RepID=UPI0033DA5AC6
MARMHPRAVILGIDGGSLDLIEPLVSDGSLPNIGALLAESLHGTTTTTWPAHTAPGWSTFVTARQPGGHGVYQFFDTQDPEYGDRLTGTGNFGCDTVWEWLARQDLSVGLINVPMSHPPRDLPGYQVTWPLSQTLRYSSPSTLLGELARAGAPFRPDISMMYRDDLGYLDTALANVQARGRSIQYLMSHRPVDVVMAVITEIDRICHHYWHFMDGCHPRHEAADEPAWAEAVRATYRAIDDVFGEILAELDEDTPVLVVSDHGFGPGRLNLGVNALLAESGLLATRDGGGDHAPWFNGAGRSVDFGRTRAYMPTPGCYAVNLNRAGRQRDGMVTEQEAPKLLSELSDMFLGLRSPDGGPVFAAALPREDAYPGPMMHRAPDLLLIPADEGVLADPGLDGGIWRPSEQTGMHRYAGMWSYRSPRVTPGRLDTPAALCDLVPTLLHDLGLRQSAGAHGRPVAAVRDNGTAPLPFLDDVPLPASPSDTARLLRDDDATARALSSMGYL